jgi:GNAT superfamily N-acetyltransferase
MAVRGSGPDPLVAAGHRCLVEGAWQYLRSTPHARRKGIPHGVLIGSALPTDLSNVLYWDGPAAELPQGIEAAEQFFGPRTPWRVACFGADVTTHTAPPAVFGLRPIEADPGMLLSPLAASPEAPAGLSIRPVTDLEALGQFSVAFTKAFGIPRFALPAVLPRVPPDEATRGVYNRFLVGLVAGSPIACATVTVFDRVAAIFSVGTVRSERGHGYGTALTWAAIEAGRSLGAESAYLAASASGLPVYERMGFRRVVEYPTWSRRLSLPARIGALWRFRNTLRDLRRGRLPPYGPESGPPPGA